MDLANSIVQKLKTSKGNLKVKTKLYMLLSIPYEIVYIKLKQENE